MLRRKGSSESYGMKGKVLSFPDYKKIKELSYNQLNIWLTSFYEQAYEDGKSEQSETSNDASVIDSEELYSLMTSAGVSDSTAEEVIRRVTSNGP